MDRQSLLEQLDSARPDSDDLTLPELAAAGEMLARDDELASEFLRRQEWDRQFALAMHDVPVPAGLEGRLLARLSQCVRPAVVGAPPKHSRRRVLAVAWGVAASVVAALAVWSIYWGANEPLTVAELQAAAVEYLEEQTRPQRFSGDFQPRLPSGNWRRFVDENRPLGLIPDQADGHRAVAWSVWQGYGVLIAVPVDEVVDPPIAGRQYQGGNSVVWTEGDFVYVCRVNGSIHDLLRKIDNTRLA